MFSFELIPQRIMDYNNEDEKGTYPFVVPCMYLLRKLVQYT